MAVFCAIVQAAGAAPNGIFSSTGRPCTPPVERPALAAHEPVRQRIFARITRASCHSRFRRTSQGAPTRHFCFYCIVLLPADDGFMVIGHRIVPMHPTLTAYLSDYRSKLPGDTEWLFPSSRGHYSRSTVYENFREMLILCKIPHTGKGPRVHDFRHTFCVHTLEKQLAAGYEPMQIMPRMAAYLGHKSYRETSWYIHLTIVSFPELSAKLSAVFSGIIPVVEDSKDEENRLF